MFVVPCFSQAAAADSQAALQEVIFQTTNGQQEMINFRLSGTYSPEVSMLKGQRPRLIFDFIGVPAAATIQSRIETRGRMISRVRLGRHTRPIKTRVVIDLVPGYEYDYRQMNGAAGQLSYAVFYRGSQPAQVQQQMAPVTPVWPQPPQKQVVEVPQMQQPIVPKTYQPPVVQERPPVPSIQQPLTRMPDQPFSGNLVVISDIFFGNTSSEGEMVLFKLNEFAPPVVTSSEVNGKLQVICEFSRSQVAENVSKLIPASGKYVSLIRVEDSRNPDKVRAIIDLTGDKNYQLKQVFFKEDNLFALIVNPRQ